MSKVIPFRTRTERDQEWFRSFLEELAEEEDLSRFDGAILVLPSERCVYHADANMDRVAADLARAHSSVLWPEE